MALNPDLMADEVVTNLKVLNPAIVEAELKPFWVAICTGIIDHIKSDGVVLPGALKDSTGATITGTGEIS